MQTLTRNPLADPGILGVNNASFAIVLGAALFGFSTPLEQLFMAFSGALIASLIVAFTGSQGGGQLSPVPDTGGRGAWRGTGRTDQRHRAVKSRSL